MKTFCRDTMHVLFSRVSFSSTEHAEYDATLKLIKRLKFICIERMHLIGSLLKLNRINEVSMHGCFFEEIIKSWKISLAT